MSLVLLDNPGWHALNSHHRHVAIRGKLAVRYQPRILMVAAMPENDSLGFDDLKSLVDADELIAVLGTLPDELVDWEIVETNHVPQMICDGLKPAPKVNAIRLAVEDVPEMLELIAIAQPGPFLRRTIELGQYFGIRQDGQLVAMAGERLHMTGFCEVSAVCTHPDYRGRGYGGALTTLVAESIFERDETPFLHVAPGNETAIRLYKKLGFHLREEIQLNILKRLA
jgi:predicted GNAT family acetyltransferase